jgi:beta-1,4-mannosyltransferase
MRVCQPRLQILKLWRRLRLFEDMLTKVLAEPGFGVRDLNPYTWLLYRHMAADVLDFSYPRALIRRYDVLHIHWPEWELNVIPSAARAAARLRMKLFTIDFVRARGTKVVWTAHNLSAHDGRHPELERRFWPAFTRRLDGYIALSESGRAAALERFDCLKRIPGYVIPHGHYRGEYPDDSNENARAALGIEAAARVILFFGQVRLYKNLPELIRAFRAMPDEHVVLCIAGRPKTEALGREIQSLAASDPRIHLHLSWVPPERIQFFFRAADLVVLPFRDILNSGSALLALSFNRPILVPNLGAMSELRSSVGSEWVRTYAGAIDAAELASALHWAKFEKRPSDAELREFEWPRLAQETLDAYEEIIAMRATPASSLCTAERNNRESKRSHAQASNSADPD